MALLDVGYLENLAKLSEPDIKPKALPRAKRAIDIPPGVAVEWLVKDLLPAGELGLLVGDGGTFKSSVAIHIAGAIACGAPVFGRYQTQCRPVLIVSNEDGEDIVRMRLEAFAAGHLWPVRQVLEQTHVMAGSDCSLGSVQWKMHLIAETSRLDPGLIVLDPWAELQGGDENSNTDARPAIQFIRALARLTNAVVMVVHHAGKAGQDKRTLDRIRGASALPSASRMIFFTEYLEEGVSIENLKMSRAPRLRPFVVRRDIASRRDNRAIWTSARLWAEEGDAFQLGKAERWIVSQLRMAPGGVRSTTDLRDLGSGIGGVRREDQSRALEVLQSQGVINFRAEKQGRKMWYLTNAGRLPDADRPRDVVQGNDASTANGGVSDPAQEFWAGWAGSESDLNSGQNTPKIDPAQVAQTLPGQGSGPAPLPGPFRGPAGGGRARPGTGVGRVELSDIEERIAEREALRSEGSV